MRSRIPLNLPLVVTVLFWGFNFVAVKLVYRDIPPLVVLFDRALLMGLLLAGVCRWRKLSLRYPQGDALRILLAGFLGMGVYMVLFLEGISMTSPAEGAIMLASAPIFTFFLASAFRQEAFTWPALAGNLVGFAGVVIVILGGSSAGTHGTLEGNLITLFSAVIWALAVVVMRPLLHKYDATQAFTLSIPGALPVLLAFGLMPAIHFDYAAVTPFGWLMFLQITVMSGVVAFVTFYVGIHQIGSHRAGFYQYFIPPTAALFQWLVYGQMLSLVQWGGLLVLLLGVIYASRARVIRDRRDLIPIEDPVPDNAIGIP